LTWINQNRAVLCQIMGMNHIEHLPGEPATRTGEYLELNVFGAATGWSVYAKKDTPLPRLPRGFTWRHVPEQEPERCEG
jgi:hypothetical protein